MTFIPVDVKYRGVGSFTVIPGYVLSSLFGKKKTVLTLQIT